MSPYDQSAKVNRTSKRRQGNTQRKEMITNYFDVDNSSNDSLTVNIPREILAQAMDREGRRRRPVSSTRDGHRKLPARPRGPPTSRKANSHRRKAGRPTERGKEESMPIPDGGDTELDEATFNKVRDTGGMWGWIHCCTVPLS